ncbi:MAG: NrtA/SsuA/CpmA family ABC transporter substrate-binding protein [Chloroflexi bacterium]|nr:NrtA/SsuA/CpmA family ABC transporter substrate-binding protein [Chloroflexota bacterium]
MKTKRIVIALVLAAISGVLALSCSPGPQAITVGEVPSEAWALIHVADEQGLFSRNGLAVTFQKYETGLAAIDAVMKGEADLTPTGEYPLVGRAFRKENFSIIGVISKSFSWSIIGRKDHGIGGISDLKGKKIALLRQGLGEFYLGRFLDLNGLNMADVLVIDTAPSKWVEVISEGSVDAVVVWRLYVDPIKERLGDRIVVWPAQSNQPAFSVISGRTDWVTQHPETVKRFLEALAQAEEYSTGHETEARAILQRLLQLDAAAIDNLWPDHRFSLSLDYSLIAAMNDQARWMISYGLTTEKNAPDFRDHIYVDGLASVKPGAVDIIPLRGKP